MEKNLRVIFTKKADVVLFDILKNNGLEESEEEFFSKLEQDKEPKETIIKYAAITITKKIMPDENLIELLQKHLETSNNTAEKIVHDIKNKLLPLLLVYPSERFNDPVFREEISKKIFESENEGKQETKGQGGTLSPFVKKVEVTNVEKNAEILEKEREKTSKIGTVGEELQKKGQSDKYRESIE